MTDITRTVEKTLREYELLNAGEHVIVGVSGGADSVCLLHILHSLNQWRLKTTVFHLHHGLRGKEADADERFVRRLCGRLKIPCVVHRQDTRAFARAEKLSLEEAGRELRYRHFQQVAAELKAHRIAVAHNADDNAETVILNLVRGSGLTGLSGIPIKRGQIIRPLLRCTRAEIEHYLKKHRFRWCRDLSNYHLEFRRNFVRQRILPLMKKLNPRMVTALSRTSEILRADDALLNQFARLAIHRIARPSDLGHLLDSDRFVKYNPALQRRIVKGLMPELQFEDIQRVIETVSGRVGRRAILKNGAQVWKEHQGTFLGLVPRPYPKTPFLLTVPGRNCLPEFGIALETECDKVNKISCNRSPRLVEVFDLKDIHLPLMVRRRKPGDRLAPFGGRTRKLQDILIDDKIPQRLRDHLPVLVDQKGILWVIGSRRARRALVTAETKRTLTIAVKEL